MDSPSHRYHFESQRPADAKTGATRGEPESDILLQQKKKKLGHKIGRHLERSGPDERESQEHRVRNCVTHRSRSIENRND